MLHRVNNKQMRRPDFKSDLHRIHSFGSGADALRTQHAMVINNFHFNPTLSMRRIVLEP